MSEPAPGTAAPKGRALVLAMLALVACAWAFITRSPNATASRAPAKAPSLDVAATPCPPTGHAAERAREAEAAALARIARYPFEASEGTAALRAFAEATACFEHASERAERDRVEAQARQWRAKLERDYHGAQVRLERALHDRRGDLARVEARTLLSLLSGTESPYTRRLRVIVETRRPAKGTKP